MKKTLIFDRIETRTVTGVNSKFPKYLIKGYAIANDIPHVHKFMKDASGKVVKDFKSLFTRSAVEKMSKDLGHKDIFVDALHDVAATINSRDILQKIKEKGADMLDEELAALEANLKMKELPMFNYKNFELRPDGLFVEIETNPFYAEFDEAHEKHYNAIVGSLLNKSINGMSINFNATKVVQENGLDKIDDLDIYGISLVPNAALGSSTPITEVVMRSIQEVMETREEKMEEDKTKKPEEKKPEEPKQPDVDEIVEKKVEAALKSKEVEAQKKAQAEQMQSLQEELEKVRQEKEALEKEKVQAKGIVHGNQPAEGGEGALTAEQLKERIDTLSHDELLLLQAEFGQKLPKFKKVQEYPPGKKYAYAKTKLEPLDAHEEMLYGDLTRRRGSDLVVEK